MDKKIFISIFSAVIIISLISSCQRGKNKLASKITNKIHWEQVSENLAFPEGPAWDRAGSIYFSNCNGGWIAKYHDGKTDTFLMAENNSFQKTNGLAFRAGFLYACEYGTGKILKISPAGKVETYADRYEGENFNRPNDLAFDKQGNLYFTDPKSYGAEKLDGRLFCIKKNTGKVVLMDDSLAFPNGIAFYGDGDQLYVCESALNRIVKYDINKNGNLSDKQTFVELPGGDPDGIAFDSEGNLYAAHFGGGHMYVISRRGKILKKVETPGEKPTNLEFGGRDLKTLYLTEVETQAMYRAKVDIPGLPLYPAE